MVAAWDWFTDSSLRMSTIDEYSEKYALHALEPEVDEMIIKLAYQKKNDRLRNGGIFVPESQHSMLEERNASAPDQVDNDLDEVMLAHNEIRDRDPEDLYEVLQHVSLFCPRFPTLVRDYLNLMLDDFINDNLPQARPGVHHPRWTHAQHDLFILVPCAMILGCHLPEGFLDVFKRGNKRYKDDPGMPFQSIEKACGEYINGKPYRFKHVWIDDDAYEGFPPELEPLPSVVDTTSTGDEPARKRTKTDAEMEIRIVEHDFWFPPDACANCGTTEGHKEASMQRCSGCKEVVYCFKGCQTWHWPTHSWKCRKVQQGAEEKAADVDGDGKDDGRMHPAKAADEAKPIMSEFSSSEKENTLM
ncbi:Hypothetical protein D9617_4g001580 [Elsinoe fawcettii]|nr:Hypothetical protein D9617_4g001580 [Elsinoe fawcettii]